MEKQKIKPKLNGCGKKFKVSQLNNSLFVCGISKINENTFYCDECLKFNDQQQQTDKNITKILKELK